MKKASAIFNRRVAEAFVIDWPESCYTTDREPIVLRDRAGAIAKYDPDHPAVKAKLHGQNGIGPDRRL